MKNKIISLLLALTLVLSMGMVQAEDEASAPVAAPSQKDILAVEHLKILGLTDKEDVINPDSPITRGELANVAANMMGITLDSTGEGLSSTIIDVDSNPYGKQIHALVFFKILSGVNPYQYFPDNNVRYNEALKVLLSVLGYGEDANVRGGYPNGYIRVAATLDIAVGAIKNHEAITWGELARMVEEFYDVPLREAYVTGNEITFTQVEGKTFLSHYLDVVKVVGEIKDNGYTTRTTASNLEADKVLIGSTVVAKGNTDIENKIGATVSCYAKKDVSGKLTALFYTVDYNVDMLEIKAEEITSTTRTKITYRRNNASKSITISALADVIYNGTTYPNFDAALLDIENGKITLYDDDKTKGGYDLLVIEEFESFVVASPGVVEDIVDGSSVEISKNTVTGTLGEICALDDYDTYFTYNEKYEKISLDDVLPGYVASVYRSLTNGLCRIVFTNNNVEGKISSMDIGEETYYYIGEDKYKLAHSLKTKIDNNVMDTFTPEIGVNYQYKLDIEGNIAGIVNPTAGEQYGYLTNVSTKSPDSFGDEYTYFRVATINGFVTLRSAKKVTVNYSDTKTLGRDVINEPTLYVDDNLANDFEPQLIQFELNSAGDVIALNTATTTLNGYGYNAEKFSLDKELTNVVWHGDHRSFDYYKYTLTKDAQIFIVPESLNEDEFKVLIPAEMPAGTSTNYSPKLYDYDSTMSAHAAVIVGDFGDQNPEGVFAVETASRTREADGEMHLRLRGYLGESYREFVELEPGYIESTIGQVKPGDILKIALKSGKSKFNHVSYVEYDKMIVKAERLTSLEEVFENKAAGITTNGDIKYFYGTIYARNQDATTVLVNQDTSNPTTEDLIVVPTTTYVKGLYVYDLEEQKYTPVSYNDIVATSTVYKDGSVIPDWSSIVFMQRFGSATTAKMTILIKE